MQRFEALALTAVLFLFFFVVCYYYVRIKFFSSLAFSSLVSLFLLNIFYRPTRLATDGPDAGLIVYAVFVSFALFCVCAYTCVASMTDYR